MGETVVMTTVVGAKKVNPETDYFPLSVNYQEKYYRQVRSQEATLKESKTY